jgi:hypothetical protein
MPKEVEPSAVLEKRKIINSLIPNCKCFSFRHNGQWCFTCFFKSLGIDRPGIFMIKSHHFGEIKQGILEVQQS